MSSVWAASIYKPRVVHHSEQAYAQVLQSGVYWIYCAWNMPVWTRTLLQIKDKAAIPFLHLGNPLGISEVYCQQRSAQQRSFIINLHVVVSGHLKSKNKKYKNVPIIKAVTKSYSYAKPINATCNKPEKENSSCCITRPCEPHAEQTTKYFLLLTKQPTTVSVCTGLGT